MAAPHPKSPILPSSSRVKPGVTRGFGAGGAEQRLVPSMGGNPAKSYFLHPTRKVLSYIFHLCFNLSGDQPDRGCDTLPRPPAIARGGACRLRERCGNAQKSVSLG